MVAIRKTAFIAIALAAIFVGGAEAQQKPAALGSSWGDISRMPDFFSGMWQSSSAMVDGPTNAKLTDKAKAYVQRYTPVNDIPLAGVDCKNPGLPITQRAGSPLKFMFEPGMISVYIEQASMTRFIRLNDKLPSAPDPSYLGTSVARWEGDTLVVESVGFRDDIVFQYTTREPKKEETSFLNRSVFGPHGPNLRMVERMRLRDPDTLEIKLTIYDDTVFVGPYESQPVQTFHRIRGQEAWPGEWQCDTALASPFDPATNTVISPDPEEALKQLEKGVLR
jgi:hypothetical protein